MSVRVTVGGVGGAGAPPWVDGAVSRGGGEMVSHQEAEAVIWLGLEARELSEWLDAHEGIRWVQLVHAGIESYAPAFASGRPDLLWTCAKGAFARAVAEHALTLALSLLKGIRHAVAGQTWRRVENRSLFRADVVIVGGGGIAESLIDLLRPFDVHCTVVRRSGVPVPTAQRTVMPDQLHEVLTTADAVFLALSMTSETRGTIGRAELAAMKKTAILVNVARGGVILTDDLVRALDDGTIFGAGLDVTDPEPLPDGHPLWTNSRCIITSHSANSAELYNAALADRVRDNVGRFGRDEPLLGLVDVKLGY